MTAWKYHWFCIPTLIFCVLEIALLLWSWGNRGEPKERGGSHISPLMVAIAAYIAFTLCSSVVSSFQGTLIGLYRYDGALTTLLYGVAALLLMRVFRFKRWMLNLFTCSVSLFCGIGLMQLTGRNPLSLFPAGMTFYDAGVKFAGEFWSTIGNSDYCSAFLSLAAGVLLSAAIRDRSRLSILYGAAASLCVFSLEELHVAGGLTALMLGMILLPPLIIINEETLRRLGFGYSGVFVFWAMGKFLVFYDGGLAVAPSKTGFLFLGMAALFAGFALFLPREFVSDGIKMRRTLAVCSALILIAGIAFVYLSPALPSETLVQAHELLHGNADPSFGSGRIHIWRQVLGAIKEHPLFGGGPDTLGARGLEGFSRYDDTLGLMIVSTIDAAHNEYLNIWANQGLLALLSYLAILGICIRRVWVKPDSCQTAVAGAGMLFYLIQAFFGIAFCSTTVYLWLAVALIGNDIYIYNNVGGKL